MYLYHILALVDACDDIGSKLDLLTTISITTSKDEVSNAAEAIRNSLPDSPSIGIEQIREEIIRHPVVGKESNDMCEQEGSYDGALEECEEVNEDSV